MKHPTKIYLNGRHEINITQFDEIEIETALSFFMVDPDGDKVMIALTREEAKQVLSLIANILIK